MAALTADASPVQRGQRPPRDARGRLPGADQGRGRVQRGPRRHARRAWRRGGRPGRRRDDRHPVPLQLQPRRLFAQTLQAEWTKFRTVRGWVIGLVVAALAIVALGLGPSAAGLLRHHGPASDCTQPLGPGGEAVTDSFYFAHQPLDGNGTITVRVTSLTGQIPDFSARRRSGPADAQPAWCPGPRPGSSSRPAPRRVGLRGDDGHRRPRRADAVRLHRRHAARPARPAVVPPRRRAGCG